jgi:glycyl-tRNA synthetase alpha chain
MFLQGVDNVYDLQWNQTLTYRDVHHKGEVEWSTHNFETADIALQRSLFEEYERESVRLIGAGLVLPAYDYCLKCSHTFNILDARGAISVTERTHYIGRVRALARRVADAYLKQREEMGYPLLRTAR